MTLHLGYLIFLQFFTILPQTLAFVLGVKKIFLVIVKKRQNPFGFLL